ncbi:MAG: hypothetical protein ACJ8AW_20300 [Rhodopila sp.]
MSGSRPNIFDEIDLSGFEPKSEVPPPSPDLVRTVSEEGGFPSRAPRPRAPTPASEPPPASSRRLLTAKTGRTVLLNARITQRAHDRFHGIVEAERMRYEAGEITHRVTLGEVVERALAALERELG